MTLYEEMVEMLEDEQEWIKENSTTDDDEYEQYLNNKLGFDREVQYSLKGSYYFDYDDYMYRYIFNLDEIVIMGKVFVVGSGLCFINPTRLDICIAAEHIIHNTGDYSHIYLENYKVYNYYDFGIKYCELDFGS